MVIGTEDSKIPEKYKNNYDFVICPSMINNNGFDRKVFLDLLYCLKVDGFVVFATKLNYFKQDIYENDIKSMVEDGYWNFTAEH